MNDMLESQTVRAKRLALRNLQEACQIYQKTQIQKGKTFTNLKKPQKLLGQLIRNIRVNRLSQYVTQNLLQNNIFGKRMDFSIKGSNQIDEQRLIKWEGVRFNQKILAIIYILEIIFVLVTLFLSAFVAFIQGFRNLEYQKQGSIVIMNLFAIFFSVCKIGTSVITKKIKDGITLVYISDIFYDYVSSFVIFIDIAYLIMLICLLIEGNNSVGFGVVLFFLCLVKMISCFPNLSVFETTFIKGFRNQNYWKLAKTVIFNIGFAHFLASMLLAMANASDTQNWLIKRQLTDKEWWVQYMWAYYWATTIMMTIGFGDITATNHSEAIVLAFLEFFSCIVLAYNVSEIGAVISALRSAGNEYQKKISIFKRMATQDQIDVQLKTKIQGYLKQERQINETYEFHEQTELLNSIPDNLKKQYINQSNKKFFTYIPFFKNIRKVTLMKFTQHFNGRVYYPGQYLLSLHQDQDNIMILKEGRVGLTYKKQGSRLNGTPVQSLEIDQKMVHVQNDIFEKKIVPIILNTNFLNRTSKTNYEIIAQSYCFAYSISYQNFLASIKESQVDSSYYFSILHRTSISKNQWVQIQCQKCNNEAQISQELDIEKNRRYSTLSRSINFEGLKNQKRKEYHTKFQCPKLHYCPLKGIVVLKSIKSKGNPQKGNRNFMRKKQRQGHSYLAKKIFKPFENRINIHAKKRLQAMIVKDYLESMQNSKASQRIQSNKYFTLESNEQVQMLQKLIKKSLHQVIQGYQEGYWDLQIDVMNNYLSYFPTNNASNFDNTPLQTPDIQEIAPQTRSRSEQQKVHISEIQEFQTNVEKTRHAGYQVLPNKIRTSKMKIQTSQGNEEGKKHYFKKILMSDKALGTSLYSPKHSKSHNKHTEIQEDHVSDDDISEREHSVIAIRTKEKDSFMKRKSSN